MSTKEARSFAEQESPKWKTELWSHLSNGDGNCCPILNSCKLKSNGVLCLSEHGDYRKTARSFVDGEEILSCPETLNIAFSICPKNGRIFKLVRKLAHFYRVKAGAFSPPIPIDLITKDTNDHHIEVRFVPLKTSHGAVWRLKDSWLVYLNSNDTSAKQRITLYHEIFHVLAHCHGTPVFNRGGATTQGSFNEMLADHFALVMLLPKVCIVEKWAEVKDIDKMAEIFDAPKPAIWFALNHLI